MLNDGLRRFIIELAAVNIAPLLLLPLDGGFARHANPLSLRIS